MKKIFRLLKAYIKKLKRALIYTKRPFSQKQVAAELEKEWANYLKEQETKTPARDQQRKLLHQFIHFHTDN